VIADLLQRARTLWARVIRTDASALAAVAVTVVAAWCFLEIADEVAEGSTRRLDEWTIRVLRQPHDASGPLGPRWLGEVMRDVTALGGITVLMLVIGMAAGFLLINRAYHAVWLVLSASLGGLLLSVILKGFFRRPRPEMVTRLADAGLSSFPSGHTMNSAVVYLTLGLVLSQLSTPMRLKAYFLAVATLLTYLVGISRVFLGVDYPSDVIAGWAAGAAWAGICWLVARRLRRAGSIESIR